jgi:hypothetical protein
VFFFKRLVDKICKKNVYGIDHGQTTVSIVQPREELLKHWRIVKRWTQSNWNYTGKAPSRLHVPTASTPKTGDYLIGKAPVSVNSGLDLDL